MKRIPNFTKKSILEDLYFAHSTTESPGWNIVKN